MTKYDIYLYDIYFIDGYNKHSGALSIALQPLLLYSMPF